MAVYNGNSKPYRLVGFTRTKQTKKYAHEDQACLFIGRIARGVHDGYRASEFQSLYDG